METHACAGSEETRRLWAVTRLQPAAPAAHLQPPILLLFLLSASAGPLRDSLLSLPLWKPPGSSLSLSPAVFLGLCFPLF